MSAATQFIDLVQRLSAQEIARSENDLSARLSRCYEEIGLSTVIDTSSGQDTRKRPDITLHVDAGSADLAGVAEVAIEAKKPGELPGELMDALIGTNLWTDKFIPYVRAHIAGIQYFCLTTFERHLYVRITPDIRTLIADGAVEPDRFEAMVRNSAQSFDLRSNASEWVAWVSSALSAEALAPLPISDVLDLASISTAEELDSFADELATLIAGEIGEPESPFALVHAIRVSAEVVSDLPPDVAASLSVYVLAQHPAMDAAAANEYLASHLAEELANFISASVQSLVGRLFAFKVIEDCFCIGVEPPLIEPQQYVFHTDTYNALSNDQLVTAVFQRIRGLEADAPPAIQNLAKTGRFYDWIETRADANAFRRVFRTFASHQFGSLSGDLLGRFFEHYAQRVDKRRRRAFGQYYTPPAIVAFIWTDALRIAGERAGLEEIRVLDPGAGSAAFLTEGARRMAAAGVPRFWEKLVGFDLDPQVIGVAYVNLFLAVLSGLERADADEVDNLRLYPTDALEPTSATRLASYLPLLTAAPLREYLSQQIELSSHVKASGTYDIVVGNPPYKNNSNRTLQQVAEVFPRLLATSRANAGLGRRNIRDDYAWFFAAADSYIRNDGLIAFVVSSSFCSANSYEYFRCDLLRHYAVRRIVHLGDGIFQDVGPRTSFVIVILERREAALAQPDENETFTFNDLRENGTPEDRLALLSAAAGGDWTNWPIHADLTPKAQHKFALLPIGDIAGQVTSSGPVLFPLPDGAESVFLRKWPGLITALDSLFRAAVREDLEAKMQDFFACAAADERTREQEAARYFDRYQIGEDDRPRILQFMTEVPARQLIFEAHRLKRVVSGTSPNTDRWYPSPRMTSWVYYEPRLRVPRNINEGRPVGYGTMTQWREPQVHAITPKLIFSTASSSRNGLKAFVVRDEWFVKLHGGTRQQFHFTGCENPNVGANLDGLPNNLGAEAATLWEALRERGNPSEDFLLYVASFYNTGLAEEFVEGGGGPVLHIPMLDLSAALEIATAARRIRDLTFSAHSFAATPEISTRDFTYDLDWMVEEGIADRQERGGGRFQPTTFLVSSATTGERISQSLADEEETLDRLVREAYGLA